MIDGASRRSPASRETSARFVLRDATADLHTELDTLLSRVDFDDARAYVLFLTRQAAPLFALEEALDASRVAADIGDWPARRRSAAIRADLALLASPSPSPIAHRVRADDDTMLGALYVLEGSRLGAKFLVRQARASRDPDVRAATAYLGHGDGVNFWPSYLAMLAQREARGLDADALVAGARDAFTIFLDAAKFDLADFGYSNRDTSPASASRTA